MAKTKEKEASGRSKLKTLGRVALMGFVALWMFTLGVLVGRGTVPVHFDLDEIQQQLAELKQRVTTEEGERFKVNLEKLNFFKSLKETESKPSGPVPRIEAKFKKPLERVPVQQPAPEGFLPRSGEAAAGSVSEETEGGLFIQIASSKDADATRHLVTRLKKAGHPAFSVQIEVPSKGVWYRIQTGPYRDQAVAGLALAGLKKEYSEAYIVER